jgi:SAM-dependent methyltransferase
MSGTPPAEPRASGDHVRRNREAWGGFAAEYVEPARQNWSQDEPTWGIFGVPESHVGMLPDDLEGKDVVELGCGTGYVSAWMARRGARPTGVDLTPEQLATARDMQREFDLRFPLVRADAELLPLQDGSFDVAISEYGASIWCDPYRWIPEAARVLRPEGELVFLGNGTIMMLCVHDLLAEGAADATLRRDYFGMHRFEWADDDSVEFHLGYGDWIRLLRSNGFEVTDLIEIRPSEDAVTRYPFVDREWARRWPCEEVWKARKLG